MKDDSQMKAGLEKIYDGWSKSGTPHWEEAPGKNVLIGALKACCPTEKPSRLPDIGCGTGTFLARIHEEVSKHSELHDMDFSLVAIRQARRKYPLHFSCADATSLEYSPGAFDIVTWYGSWAHFQDPANAIPGAGRVLAPGGCPWNTQNGPRRGRVVRGHRGHRLYSTSDAMELKEVDLGTYVRTGRD